MAFRPILLLVCVLPALAQISFTTGQNGLTSLQYSGSEFNYKYAENLLTTVRFSSTSTSVIPGCSTSVTSSTVTKTCSGLTLTVAYTMTDQATLNVAYSLENTGNAAIENALISTIGIATTQFNPEASKVQSLSEQNPTSFIDYSTGQVFLWNNAPSPDSSLQMFCGLAGSVCKNQVHLYSIDPSTTKTVSYSLRFVPYDPTTGAPVAQPVAAPEAYAAYQASYPFAVTWTDHRPIMAWFISDYAKRSKTNPRGYLQQPNIDVTDGTFASRVLTQANKIVSQIKARPVQPQGLLIWDLEGQEFIHATTYVGDPRILSQGYAAEMDAVADQLFSVFKNAGYKVGVTLRPQYLQWGTTFPETCHPDAKNEYKDYFIKVDGGFGEKFYSCRDADGPKWYLIPQGNGGQTFYQPTNSADVTALLLSKVEYAHSRWGATIFYVDSTVWVGGTPLPAQVFRDLQTAYPDCLFIPEQGYIGTAAVAAVYREPRNVGSAKFFPPSWSWVYPNGFQAVYLANCVDSCWTTNYDQFVRGQTTGDIAIYTQPGQISPDLLGKIESMIQSSESLKLNNRTLMRRR